MAHNEVGWETEVLLTKRGWTEIVGFLISFTVYCQYDKGDKACDDLTGNLGPCLPEDHDQQQQAGGAMALNVFSNFEVEKHPQNLQNRKKVPRARTALTFFRRTACKRLKASSWSYEAPGVQGNNKIVIDSHCKLCMDAVHASGTSGKSATNQTSQQV